MAKKSANKTARLHFFTVRIVEIWNSLPAVVVNATNINAFKNGLDKFWNTQDIVTNFKSDINTKSRNPEVSL